eukprot:CAMPEP_0197539364 /NCGR_PEP_ID=MMETSP1318-20131121/62505_1 /TAXON_ID=552666 /ORGANISM="Partenskyella glossopodia, Strain RCC365" /LENGTH=64 /DNA_ID=CAMNT_0043098059 /DNA_START=16 /DNA_END=207 /DNA_ORIENTATION=+
MPDSYDYDSDGKRRSKKKKKKKHKSKSGYGSQPAREKEWTPRLIKMRDMILAQPGNQNCAECSC